MLISFTVQFSYYILLVIAVIVSSLLEFSIEQISVGFYSSACPRAELIVRSVVEEAAQKDPSIPAALLRLHFHDCFVKGCDGSVLIDGPNAERSAINHAGLRGFEVIETAKAQLEGECPLVVSCADIVALAARDSIILSNGPGYQVPTGRRDGLVSDVSDADNMPQMDEPIQQIRDKFAEKGLNEKDLVLLTAAHTIGTTACFFLEKRLYNFSTVTMSDPSINPEFLPELTSVCPLDGDVNVRLPLDRGSPLAFDDSILRNIKNGLAVIESDAKLYEEESTKSVIDSYLGLLSGVLGPFFGSDFADAIVKMGKIGETSSNGEIRRVCSSFN